MDNTDPTTQFNQQIENFASTNQFTISPIPVHTHNGTDSPLVTDIDIPAGKPILLGFGGIISTSNNNLHAPGSVSEQIQTSIASGKEQTGGASITTTNMQLNLLHQPQNASNQSFINAYRPPVWGTLPGTTISVTAGGNTLTTSGYGFQTNALAGAIINIYNSSGTFIESQVIASNTATVITITGTWVNNTTGGTFFVLQPVFMGSADTIFQRFYTAEGTGGGIRFGIGTTNGGQNGLLYMDAAGDPYWRDKSGTSTKLLTGTGTVTSFSFTNGNGFTGSVATATTTPALTLDLVASGVLYRDGGIILGATLTTTNKFLNGQSAFAQVKDSDLSVSNVTTNDVTTAQHGFMIKAPNDTTKFFRGDATWAALPSGNVTYTNGSTSKNCADASTTQNIAHGLGKTPAKVKLTFSCTSSNAVAPSGQAWLAYNGTTSSCMGYQYNGAVEDMNSSGNIKLYAADNLSTENQTGVVTFDATNIIITWTKSASFGTPLVFGILWEAEG